MGSGPLATSCFAYRNRRRTEFRRSFNKGVGTFVPAPYCALGRSKNGYAIGSKRGRANRHTRLTSNRKSPASNLSETLDRIDGACEGEPGRRVTLGIIISALGARTFGPTILLAGMIIIAPIIGDIPGVPTIMGLIVLIAAVQQIAGRQHFWLPRKILDWPLSIQKARKATHLFRKPAKWIDKLLARRLAFLTTGTALRVVGVACFLIGAALPLMEFVPFSANLAGLALTLFGLGLIANDGIITAAGLAVVGIISWIIVRTLL